MAYSHLDFNESPLFSNETMDVFLNYKYAVFNKPEQHRDFSNIAVEMPFVDIQACIKYNNELAEFVKKPFEQRVTEILKNQQCFNPEATLEYHLRQMVSDISHTNTDGYTQISHHKCPSYDHLQQAIEDDFTLDEIVLLFHLLDIYYSDQCYTYTNIHYPFFANQSVYAKRISIAEPIVMSYICDNLDAMVDDGDYGYNMDWTLASRAILNGLYVWWTDEQMARDGIRVDLKTCVVDFVDDADINAPLDVVQIKDDEAQAIHKQLCDMAWKMIRMNDAHKKTTLQNIRSVLNSSNVLNSLNNELYEIAKKIDLNDGFPHTRAFIKCINTLDMLLNEHNIDSDNFTMPVITLMNCHNKIKMNKQTNTITCA